MHQEPIFISQVKQRLSAQSQTLLMRNGIEKFFPLEGTGECTSVSTQTLSRHHSDQRPAHHLMVTVLGSHLVNLIQNIHLHTS